MAHLNVYLLIEYLNYIFTAVFLALANFLPSDGNPLKENPPCKSVGCRAALAALSGQQPAQDRNIGPSGQLPETPSSALPSGPETSQDRNSEPSRPVSATPCEYWNTGCNGRK